MRRPAIPDYRINERITAPVVRLVDQEGAQRGIVPCEDALTVARFLADVQQQRLSGAVDRVTTRMSGPCEHVLTSGSGEFLADRVAETHRQLAAAQRQSLNRIFDAEVSRAACAMAVARLAQERLPG